MQVRYHLIIGLDFQLNPKLAAYAKAILDFNVSYPFEVKLKYAWPKDEFNDGVISREFNHGPAIANANIELRFTGKDRPGGSEFEWNVFNFSFSWALTDKVFNRCCYPWSVIKEGNYDVFFTCPNCN